MTVHTTDHQRTIARELLRLVRQISKATAQAKIHKKNVKALGRRIQVLDPFFYEIQMFREPVKCGVACQRFELLKNVLERTHRLVDIAARRGNYLKLFISGGSFMRDLVDVTRDLNRCIIGIPLEEMEVSKDTKDMMQLLMDQLSKGYYQIEPSEDEDNYDDGSGSPNGGMMAENVIRQAAQQMDMPEEEVRNAWLDMHRERDRREQSGESIYEEDDDNEDEGKMLDQLLSHIRKAGLQNSGSGVLGPMTGNLIPSAGLPRGDAPLAIPLTLLNGGGAAPLPPQSESGYSGTMMQVSIPLTGGKIRSANYSGSDSEGNYNANNVPQEFICYVCDKLMIDPVTVQTGYTYCRKCAQKFFDRGKPTCPISGHELTVPSMHPNMDLQRIIGEWRLSNPGNISPNNHPLESSPSSPTSSVGGGKALMIPLTPRGGRNDAGSRSMGRNNGMNSESPMLKLRPNDGLFLSKIPSTTLSHDEILAVNANQGISMHNDPGNLGIQRLQSHNRHDSISSMRPQSGQPETPIHRSSSRNNSQSFGGGGDIMRNGFNLSGGGGGGGGTQPLSRPSSSHRSRRGGGGSSSNGNDSEDMDNGGTSIDGMSEQSRAPSTINGFAAPSEYGEPERRRGRSGRQTPSRSRAPSRERAPSRDRSRERPQQQHELLLMDESDSGTASIAPSEGRWNRRNSNTPSERGGSAGMSRDWDRRRSESNMDSRQPGSASSSRRGGGGESSRRQSTSGGGGAKSMIDYGPIVPHQGGQSANFPDPVAREMAWEMQLQGTRTQRQPIMDDDGEEVESPREPIARMQGYSRAVDDLVTMDINGQVKRKNITSTSGPTPVPKTSLSPAPPPLTSAEHTQRLAATQDPRFYGQPTPRGMGVTPRDMQRGSRGTRSQYGGSRGASPVRASDRRRSTGYLLPAAGSGDDDDNSSFIASPKKMNRRHESPIRSYSLGGQEDERGRSSQRQSAPQRIRDIFSRRGKSTDGRERPSARDRSVDIGGRRGRSDYAGSDDGYGRGRAGSESGMRGRSRSHAALPIPDEEEGGQFDPRILEALRQLTMDSSIVVTKGARTLSELAEMPQMRTQIYEAGSVPMLTALIKSGRIPKALDYSAAAIVGLLNNSDGPADRIFMAVASAMLPLIPLLWDGGNDTVRATIASILASVAADDDVRTAILEQKGVVPALAGMALSSSPSARTPGLKALMRLAGQKVLSNNINGGDSSTPSEQSMQYVYAALVKMTVPEVGEVARLEAVDMLRQLARREDANRLAIARAGGVEALLQVIVEAPNMRLRERPLAVLWYLARNETVAQVIKEAGAISPLVEVLHAAPTVCSPECKENAAGALAALAYFRGDNQTAIKRAGGIPPLVRMLEDPAQTIGCKENAASALAKLAAGSEESRTAIRKARGIPHIVELARAGANQSSRERAISVIWQLSVEARARKALREAGAVHVLVDLIKEPVSSSQCKEDSAGTLQNLAADDEECRIAVRAANGIKVLVDIVRGGQTPRMRERATGALWNLSCSDASKVAICEAGGIEVLVDMVKGGPTDLCKENAAAALRMLASNSEVNRDAIREAGGIPPLVEILRSVSKSTTVAQEKAAGALWNLAFGVANKVAIREARGIPALVELLQLGPSPTCKENAAGALRVLAVENEENKAAVREAGGIEPLVDLVRDGPTPVCQEKAAGALRILAADNEPNMVAICQAGGVPPLVALMRRGPTASCREVAVEALRNLSCHPDNMAAIREAGGVSSLVDLVKQVPTGKLRENATGVLRNLSFDQANMVTIRDAGGIEPLVELLKSNQPALASCKENAVVALWCLACNPENRMVIVDSGGIPLLVSVLSDSKEHTSALSREKAAGAIQHIAMDDPSIPLINDAGGIPLLLDLIREPPTIGARVNALGALCNVACAKDSQVPIREAGGVALLVEVLRTEQDVACQEKAAMAIRNLSKDEENKIGIIEVNGAVVLANVLRVALEQSPTLHESVVDALRNLCLDPLQAGIVTSVGAIPNLVDAVNRGSTALTKEAAAEAVWGLAAANDSNLKPIREAGAVSFLMEMVQAEGTTPSGKEKATKALYNLTADVQCRKQISRMGGQSLFKAMASDNKATPYSREIAELIVSKI